MKKISHKLLRSIAFAATIVLAIGVIYVVSSANAGSETKTCVCNKKVITIKCIGDSVTGGVGMKDNHQAIYGGSTYPSILYTLLVQNGVNAVVENAGHGGEKTGAIVARLGAGKLTVSEDLTFDADGCAGIIDKKIIANFASKTQVPISFTSTDDFNPIIINGKQYIAKNKSVGNNTRNTFLYKDASDPTTVIKAGTTATLSVSENDVNIIFSGINDGKSLGIDKYISILKSGAAVNGNKYIIIGPHSRIYGEGFVAGATAEERRSNYEKRMKEEFGDHFLDLNTDWFERALPIAIKNGYFADLSEKEIRTIQEKLNNRIIPAEFTYSNADNNVHLNKIGYTVIAQLVYERLLKLGYI